VNLFEGKVDAAAPDLMRIETQELGPVLVPPQSGLSRASRSGSRCGPSALPLAAAARAPNAWQGVVEDVGYMGHMSVFRVRLPGGLVIRASQSNRLRDEDPISWDEQVWPAGRPAPRGC
jgi:putrescine transport system ATP-binding protein